jgi:hypothetical protein
MNTGSGAASIVAAPFGAAKKVLPDDRLGLARLPGGYVANVLNGGGRALAG